jgi:hypothetical protein
VADAFQVARARILRYLEQRRVITLGSDTDSDVLTVSEELAERDPALSQQLRGYLSNAARTEMRTAKAPVRTPERCHFVRPAGSRG